jgi:hypothetical protein
VSRHFDILLERLLDALPAGRDNTITAEALARLLGVNERRLRALVNESIERGHLVGSNTCGYFRVVGEEDLRAGTQHVRSAALALLTRVSRVRRAASEQFAEDVLTLFDLGPA